MRISLTEVAAAVAPDPEKVERLIVTEETSLVDIDPEPLPAILKTQIGSGTSSAKVCEMLVKLKNKVAVRKECFILSLTALNAKRLFD